MADQKNPNSTRPFRVMSGGDTAKLTPSAGSGSSLSSHRASGESSSSSGQTAGMIARRRDIERRRRDAKREKEREAEEVAEGWHRVLKALVFILVFGGIGYAYWRVQAAYGNQWPMMPVWIMMATFLFGGLALMIWYVTKPDL